MNKSDTSTDGTEHGWNFGTPNLLSKASAILKGLLSSDHEIRTAIGAKPEFPPSAKTQYTFCEVYLIWYVLHHNELGGDRTTNLRFRKLSSEPVHPTDIHESAIKVNVLPLDHHEWLSGHEDSERDDCYVSAVTEQEADS